VSSKQLGAIISATRNGVKLPHVSKHIQYVTIIININDLKRTNLYLLQIHFSINQWWRKY